MPEALARAWFLALPAARRRTLMNVRDAAPLVALVRALLRLLSRTEVECAVRSVAGRLEAIFPRVCVLGLAQNGTRDPEFEFEFRSRVNKDFYDPSEALRSHFETSRKLCDCIFFPGNGNDFELVGFRDEAELFRILDELTVGRLLDKVPSEAKTQKLRPEALMPWVSEDGWISIGRLVASRVELQILHAFHHHKGGGKPNFAPSEFQIQEKAFSWWVSSVTEENRRAILNNARFAETYRHSWRKLQVNYVTASNTSDLRRLSAFAFDATFDGNQRDFEIDVRDALRLCWDESWRGRLRFRKMIEPLAAATLRMDHKSRPRRSSQGLNCELWEAWSDVICAAYRNHLSEELCENKVDVASLATDSVENKSGKGAHRKSKRKRRKGKSRVQLNVLPKKWNIPEEANADLVAEASLEGGGDEEEFKIEPDARVEEGEPCRLEMHVHDERKTKQARDSSTQTDFFENEEGGDDEWTTIGSRRFRPRPLSADGGGGARRNSSTSAQATLTKSNSARKSFSTHKHDSMSDSPNIATVSLHSRTTSEFSHPSFDSMTVAADGEEDEGGEDESFHHCLGCIARAKELKFMREEFSRKQTELERKVDTLTSLIESYVSNKFETDEEDLALDTTTATALHDEMRSAPPTPQQQTRNFHQPPPPPTPIGMLMSPAAGHAMYYDQNSAGVLFSDPGFFSLPEDGQFSSGYPQPVSIVHRRRTGASFPHEWHGHEAQPQPSMMNMYRTSSFDSFWQSEDLFLLQGINRLLEEILDFVRTCRARRQQRLATEHLVLQKMTDVVRHIWPRATVKRFGSCATDLCLPDGDLDLVICLPKVMQDEIADEPGPLEGRNAIKMTWQQNLEEALQLVEWIDSDSIKTVHAPIPIIKLKPKNPLNLQLDVSFQTENHNGLETNKLVASLQQQQPALTPLLLLLKKFLAERGLGFSYSGGLSSYGLLLLVTVFLQSQSWVQQQQQQTFSQYSVPPLTTRLRSSSHGHFAGRRIQHQQQHSHRIPVQQQWEEHLGYILLRFLNFYGRAFDPSVTGVSLSKGFFLRETEHFGLSQSTDTESLPGTTRNSLRNTGARNVPQQSVQSHRFDPIFIDDPLRQGNNVGRNCFRIAAIQRSWSDAADVLRRAMIQFQQQQNPALASEFSILHKILQGF